MAQSDWLIYASESCSILFQTIKLYWLGLDQAIEGFILQFYRFYLRKVSIFWRLVLSCRNILSRFYYQLCYFELILSKTQRESKALVISLTTSATRLQRLPQMTFCMDLEQRMSQSTSFSFFPLSSLAVSSCACLVFHFSLIFWTFSMVFLTILSLSFNFLSISSNSSFFPFFISFCLLNNLHSQLSDSSYYPWSSINFCFFITISLLKVQKLFAWISLELCFYFDQRFRRQYFYLLSWIKASIEEDQLVKVYWRQARRALKTSRTFT